MSRKRDIQEVHQLDEIDNPIPNASLHAAVVQLSPVKKGRHSSFFDGKLSDGLSEMRMVGFSPEQQKKLSNLKQQKSPIKLDNCEIKQSRQGPKMEVILKNTTKISQSTKSIDVPDEDTAESVPTTTLSQLPYIQNFQKIIVTIKVIHASDTITVTGGKRKQDVTIADNSATAKVTLWENYTGTLQLDKSYTLTNFVVREYNATKYLSMPRDGAQISEIDDIGDTEEILDTSDDEHQLTVLFNAQIVAIPHLDTYKACFRCKARVEPQVLPLGCCSKPDCSTMQRLDLCTEQFSAKITFKHGSHGNIETLHAFGNMVSTLADDHHGNVTKDDLLLAPPLEEVHFNDQKIITSFSRK